MSGQNQKENCDVKDEAYLGHRNMLIEQRAKAYEQLDKAMLTLSGGALGLSLIFLEKIAGDSINNKCLIFNSWLLLVSSMLSTLLSFHMSCKAFNKEIKITDAQYSKSDGDEPDNQNYYTKVTECLNLLSVVLLMLGILFLLFFSYCNL